MDTNGAGADATDSSASAENPIIVTSEETIEIVEVSDDTDAKGWAASLIESLKGQTEGTMPVEKDADKYNMRHPNRGKAVIFNHMKFCNGQQPRHGTEVDEHNLKVCLNSLGFHVIVYRDAPKLKILEILEILRKEDHSKADCLMVIVLSHGEQDKIFCSDGDYIPEELWNPFTADRCPTLAGKPKIFLLQACRGDQLDAGTLLKGRTQVDAPSSRKEKSYVVPNRADFLVVYSTAPGYYSWRNTQNGSWFIQSLTKVLNKYKDEKDLLSMMTIVARNVALDFESCSPREPSFDQKKQIPMITSTLIRDVYL